jgi:hypothetical protein
MAMREIIAFLFWDALPLWFPALGTLVIVRFIWEMAAPAEEKEDES